MTAKYMRDPEYRGAVPMSSGGNNEWWKSSSTERFDPGTSSTTESTEPKKEETSSQQFWTEQQRPTGSETTTSWTPPGPAPTMGEIPEFEAPEWDEGEISRIRQVRAAPGVRRLRGAVQQAMGGVYESPQIKRMTLRQALAGYGMGLESVMSGAGREARGEYGEEYGREYAGEQMEWQANAQRISQMYSGAMQAWAQSGTQVSTQEIQYGDDEENPDPWAQDWITYKPAGYTG